MDDTLTTALEELRKELYYLERDPSPHAPEVPFTLRESIAAVLTAAFGPSWEAQGLI